MVTDSVYEQIAHSGKVYEALEKCQSDISLFENSNSHQEYADALHAMASILKFYKSEYLKALDCLKLEIQVRLLHNLPNVDYAYLKSAILNSYLNRKELVIKYVNLTLESAKDENTMAVALNVKGDTVFKDYPNRSEKYYREAEQLFPRPSQYCTSRRAQRKYQFGIEPG